MPALALARKDLRRLWDFGPRHGIGNERHLIANFPGAQIAMQAHDEIEILDDTRGAIPAYGHHVVLAKQPERARDDQVAAEPIPAQPAEEKRAQILDHLDARQQPARDTRIGDPAVGDCAAVGHPHRSPHRRDLTAE